jgi:hypothetical protein
MAIQDTSDFDRTGRVGARPSHGMHPLAIRAAMVAAAWFVIAMAISFSGTIETDYLMWVTVGFSVIFFALTLGIAARAAHDPRWEDRPVSFDEWRRNDVATGTGRIASSEALVQLLTLPIGLAIGATAIGLIFVLSQ